MRGKSRKLRRGVDIVGFGPIGRELATRLVSEKELNSNFSVVSIADSSSQVYPRSSFEVLRAVKSKCSGHKLSELKFGKSPSKEASILIDLTNSDYNKLQEAKKRAISTLRAGKHFVTANKVALSNCFSEIFSFAKKTKLEIGFGATICGGRHAISVARNLPTGEILCVRAVLNASTTLILSMLEENHVLSFEEACTKAAETGVLESDWAIDLDGIDAAAKTAILANVLYPQSEFSLKDVAIRGVRDETSRQMIQENRTSSDTRVRLVSEITSERISVEPRALSMDSPLAVKGRFNVVQFDTKTLGEISIRNLGGGVELTASVIISDLKRINSVRS
jgi:homoserine dehydrogenase